MDTARISAKLDWNRMLGFEQIVADRSALDEGKLGKKVGGKAGITRGSKIGGKIGGKLGSKTGTKG